MTFSKKVQFYFQNRAKIEEWAGLRGDAASETTAFLRGTKARLQQEFEDVPTARVEIFENKSATRICAYDQAWCDSKDKPLLTAGYGWNRKKNCLNNTWLCVWIPLKIPGGKDGRQDLNSAVYDHLEPALKTEFKKGQESAFWRVIRPSRTDAWNDPDRFADELAVATRALWNTLAELDVTGKRIIPYKETHL